MSKYVYIVKNKLNSKKYIGSHCWDSEGIDPNYYGSGTFITKAIEKFGRENFTIEVVNYYNTDKECREAEDKLLKEVNACLDMNYYNVVNSSYGFSEEEKRKLWSTNEFKEKYETLLRETYIKLTPEEEKRLFLKKCIKIKEVEQNKKLNTIEELKEEIKKLEEIIKWLKHESGTAKRYGHAFYKENINLKEENAILKEENILLKLEIEKFKNNRG